eukprot:GEMP01000789.1.p2 GENE.GEMP01000789.1~~GEMP01000789.1.p2  ORF type:complete len:772 (+),score=182.16 GEMP01000789.1:110-2425(+)
MDAVQLWAKVRLLSGIHADLLDVCAEMIAFGHDNGVELRDTKTLRVIRQLPISPRPTALALHKHVIAVATCEKLLLYRLADNSRNGNMDNSSNGRPASEDNAPPACVEYAVPCVTLVHVGLHRVFAVDPKGLYAFDLRLQLLWHCVHEFGLPLKLTALETSELLLVCTDVRNFIIDADGTHPRPLGSRPHKGFYPAAPWGHGLVVCVRPNGRLWVAEQSTGAVQTTLKFPTKEHMGDIHCLRDQRLLSWSTGSMSFYDLEHISTLRTWVTDCKVVRVLHTARVDLAFALNADHLDVWLFADTLVDLVDTLLCTILDDASVDLFLTMLHDQWDGLAIRSAWIEPICSLLERSALDHETLKDKLSAWEVTYWSVQTPQLSNFPPCTFSIDDRTPYAMEAAQCIIKDRLPTPLPKNAIFLKPGREAPQPITLRTPPPLPSIPPSPSWDLRNSIRLHQFPPDGDTFMREADDYLHTADTAADEARDLAAVVMELRCLQEPWPVLGLDPPQQSILWDDLTHFWNDVTPWNVAMRANGRKCPTAASRAGKTKPLDQMVWGDVALYDTLHRGCPVHCVDEILDVFVELFPAVLPWNVYDFAQKMMPSALVSSFTLRYLIRIIPACQEFRDFPALFDAITALVFPSTNQTVVWSTHPLLNTLGRFYPIKATDDVSWYLPAGGYSAFKHMLTQPAGIHLAQPVVLHTSQSSAGRRRSGVSLSDRAAYGHGIQPQQQQQQQRLHHCAMCLSQIRIRLHKVLHQHGSGLCASLWLSRPMLLP